jgi:glycosyltransferase involved in cell wall biosynthesis
MSEASPQSASPAVSVVIATYNRSAALCHAIESVRASTLSDWELIVAGDACTDDTAECVASFADPRIRFVNLTERCGDQSGPNNRGVELARGRYIAFLNHDDLYLPEHLATCVAALEADGADLVWTACAVAEATNDAARPCRFVLSGVPTDDAYAPLGFYFASAIMFRRELAGRVGPWMKADRSYVTPSQAWLFRVWRSGAKMRFLPAIGVLVLPAWQWPGGYARRESPPHEWLTRWLQDDPRARETIFQDAALNEARQHLIHLRHPKLKRVLLRPIHALLTALGVHPYSFTVAMLHGRRGNAVRKHRQRTGSQ